MAMQLREGTARLLGSKLVSLNPETKHLAGMKSSSVATGIEQSIIGNI